MIEKKNDKLAAIILVDNASANVNKVLDCESRAWRYATIMAGRYCDFNAEIYNTFACKQIKNLRYAYVAEYISLTSCWDCSILTRVQIHTSGVR